MNLLAPELLLFALPVAAVFWLTRHVAPLVRLLRVLVASLLVLALATPYLARHSEGRDVVVVVDRSRSMPAESAREIEEFLSLIEAARGPGDRMGIVTFGATPVVERAPTATGRSVDFERVIDADGSDIHAALELARELIPAGKSGRIVLCSDGEVRGRDPLPAARAAAAEGLSIHTRAFSRKLGEDLSVDRLELPDEVSSFEPFQFSAWVHSAARVTRSWRLERDGVTLSSGTRLFEAGLNRMVFRDRIDAAGVARYTVHVDGADDVTPENNRGLGALRVRGERGALVLNHEGAESQLVLALRAAGIPTLVRSPEELVLDSVTLSAFRAVLLENVAAGRLGLDGMRALRAFVLDQGGGLAMTGGPASFGRGGYHLSPVDELMPVSMEMRHEKRRMSIALSIVLDRSGSMGASVGSGMTKMDLANAGTAEAIRMLSPTDAVAVTAVDSAPHVIFELSQVDAPEALVKQVLRIKSMGGGIFTHTALLKAAQLLEGAEQLNRHIILFADAADAEEPEGVPDLLGQLRKRNVSVSVIALGTESDPDADFLKDIAKRGEGQAYFTTNPAELPRLFAMDTMLAARATFVDQPTAVKSLPDLFGIGAELADGFPTFGGYNITYLRPEGFAGAVTLDDYAAPAFAFAFRGVGRTAAFTGQVGGTYGQEVVGWDGFESFFVTLARWLLGQESPESFFPTVRMEGREAVITVEVDPEAKPAPDTSDLSAHWTDAAGESHRSELTRTGKDTFEARVPMERDGVLVGAIHIGDDTSVPLPALALPYSPEFERRGDAEAGSRLLRRLTHLTGGTTDPSAASLFEGETPTRVWRIATRDLLALALALMLLEIAVRRLQLGGGLLRRKRAVTKGSASGATRDLRQERAAQERGSSAVSPKPGELAASEQDAPTKPAAPELGSALGAARRRADRRLGR